MFTTKVRNVCEALPTNLELILWNGELRESRAGTVRVLPAPLMTVMSHPCERVLFSSVRDANPFFHMVEAIWMLAGRNDASTLNHYVRDFGNRFAENDGKIHDAYGRRWRTAFGFDQLDVVVQKLIENPDDRQCVIAMWDPTPNGLGAENDLCGEWQTRPCNTHIYLRVREDVLDMTVCCRSNDMIWGGNGANAVHFSVLLEYLAARIDVGVGTMYQLSNNAHVYIKEVERLQSRGGNGRLFCDRYTLESIKPMPMFTEPSAIDEDVKMFMSWHDNGDNVYVQYANEWFTFTATRAVQAHRLYRKGELNKAITAALGIGAPDWRMAAVDWLSRRIK